jgi:hypothetical protein
MLHFGIRAQVAIPGIGMSKVVKNAFLTRHKIYNINSDRKLEL